MLSWRRCTSAVVTTLGLLIAGCELTVLPEQRIVAVISTSEDVGGAACGLLLRSPDGESQWEVTMPPEYFLSFDLDGRSLLTGPDGPIARTGESVRVTVGDGSPAPSACRWGTPIEASRIDRPQ